MGPGDPFTDRTTRPHPFDAHQGASRPDAPMPAASSRPRSLVGLLTGTLVGLVFGVLLITEGLGAALVVVVCAGVGAALGYVAHKASAGHLDFAEAWRALRRRS